ncbi:MAG: NAD(P)H-hydrate dehydratase [Dehalococcoidia bacterium]|nr:NAD(P)H-hydrate dehydratase [Dehalococcoidia bacterium]
MSVVKIVTAAEMRRMEEECVKLGVSTAMLMEKAGQAVAQSVCRTLGMVAGKHIVILVGPGNNGGDGLVAARYLCDWGARVSVFLAKARSEDERNFGLVRERDVAVMGPPTSGLDDLLASADAVLDALFGTGQNRGIEDVYKEALEKLAVAKRHRPALKVFAVDLPSGLNADTGQPDPVTPFADHTLTLGLPKRGLYMPEGAARAGEIFILDIGLAPHIAADVNTELLTVGQMRALLPPRSSYAHKGSFGRVMVVAGSVNYIGAAYLACAGAARVGAGLVTLAAPESIISAVAAKMPEVVYIPLPESTPGVIRPEALGFIRSVAEFDAVLIGPGLGRAAEAFLDCLLDGKLPLRLVLDADAINALAKVSAWWQRSGFEAILTPHPGEMARLLKMTIERVQSGRIAIAKEKAVVWGKTVVLKGAFTVVAASDGRCRVSPFANAALASAGTGDVLAGAVVGLLGQGLTLFDAASLGVYLHARAGERVRVQMGDTGMLASDLLLELPQAIMELKDGEWSGSG